MKWELNVILDYSEEILKFSIKEVKLQFLVSFYILIQVAVEFLNLKTPKLNFCYFFLKFHPLPKICSTSSL